MAEAIERLISLTVENDQASLRKAQRELDGAFNQTTTSGGASRFTAVSGGVGNVLDTAGQKFSEVSGIVSSNLNTARGKVSEFSALTAGAMSGLGGSFGEASALAQSLSVSLSAGGLGGKMAALGGASVALSLAIGLASSKFEESKKVFQAFYDADDDFEKFLSTATSEQLEERKSAVEQDLALARQNVEENRRIRDQLYAETIGQSEDLIANIVGAWGNITDELGAPQLGGTAGAAFNTAKQAVIDAEIETMVLANTLDRLEGATGNATVELNDLVIAMENDAAERVRQTQAYYDGLRELADIESMSADALRDRKRELGTNIDFIQQEIEALELSGDTHEATTERITELNNELTDAQQLFTGITNQLIVQKAGQEALLNAMEQNADTLTQRADAEEDYNDDLVQIAEKGRDRREDILESASERLLAQEKEYHKQREDLREDFALDEKLAQMNRDAASAFENRARARDELSDLDDEHTERQTELSFQREQALQDLRESIARERNERLSGFNKQMEDLVLVNARLQQASAQIGASIGNYIQQGFFASQSQNQLRDIGASIAERFQQSTLGRLFGSGGTTTNSNPNVAAAEAFVRGVSRSEFLETLNG